MEVSFCAAVVGYIRSPAHATCHRLLPRVVQVHRGVYAAAIALYERFLPLVYEHIESSPFSKIAFTVSG